MLSYSLDMSKNLEIEAKAMLDEKSYHLLVNHLKTYKQINYYLDNTFKDIRNNSNIGLRIRYKNNEYELTLKVDLDEGKMEYNHILSTADFKAFKEKGYLPDCEVTRMLKSLNVRFPLHILGEMITYRSDLNYKTSLISIDKSEYNSNVDYEIESEDTSMEIARQNLEDFLNKNHIEFKANVVSKYKRFIKTI